MDILEIIREIGELEDPQYGRVYVEYGGFSDSRTVLYHEGHWCFDDSKHPKYFTCPSFKDALECLINCPTEEEWGENLWERNRGGPEERDDIPPKKDEI